MFMLGRGNTAAEIVVDVVPSPSRNLQWREVASNVIRFGGKYLLQGSSYRGMKTVIDYLCQGSMANFEASRAL